MATSAHQSAWAIDTAGFPQRARPKTRKPLMMVASPIGIAPRYIEATECPKILRALSKKKIHRAA